MLPAIGVACCVYLIAQLPLTTYFRFVVWLAVGLVIYFTYSIRHSRLRLGEKPGEAPVAGAGER